MAMIARKPIVLIVDDDARVSALTGTWLEAHGYLVDYASCGSMALNVASDQVYDAIVLDILMPDMSGISVCRKLREHSHAKTPIILLSGLTSLEAKVEGLEEGADDYLVKPFAPEELLARLQVHIRRRLNGVVDEPIEIGDVRVDPAKGTATRAGKKLVILPTGLAILTVLMRAYPAVVPKDELIQKIWGAEVPESDSLRSHIYQLRKSMNDGFDEQLVQRINTVGFRFRAPRASEALGTVRRAS
jgi:DNA-binding response OmpR family regulator